MTTREKQDPVPTGFNLGDVFRANPWLFLVLAFMGGGGSGTMLSRPVFAGGIGTDEVQAMIDRSLVQNNDVLLRRIELLLARETLRGAGLSSPAFSPSEPQ